MAWRGFYSRAEQYLQGEGLVLKWLKSIFNIKDKEEEEPEEQCSCDKRSSCGPGEREFEFLDPEEDPFLNKIIDMFEHITSDDFKLAITRLVNATKEPDSLNSTDSLTKSEIYGTGVVDGLALVKGIFKTTLIQKLLGKQRCFLISMNSLQFIEYPDARLFVDGQTYTEPATIILYDYENGDIVVQVDSNTPLKDNSSIRVMSDGEVLFEGKRIDKISDGQKEDNFFPKKNIPKYNN